jgi:hypothetical protein
VQISPGSGACAEALLLGLVRRLTAVPCWLFLAAGPEGEPVLLAPRLARLHAGAGQEGLLRAFMPSPPSPLINSALCFFLGHRGLVNSVLVLVAYV